MGVELSEGFVSVASAKDPRRVDEAAALMPSEIIEHTVLAGSVERVAEQLAAALRPEIASITIRPHCVPGESVDSVVRAFAEEVIPRAPCGLRGPVRRRVRRAPQSCASSPTNFRRSSLLSSCHAVSQGSRAGPISAFQCLHYPIVSQ